MSWAGGAWSIVSSGMAIASTVSSVCSTTQSGLPSPFHDRGGSMRTRSSVAVRFLIAGTLLASILGATAATATVAGASTATQSTTCKLKAIAKFNPGLTPSQEQQ